MMKKILLHRLHPPLHLHRLMHRPIRKVRRPRASHSPEQPQLQIRIVAPKPHPSAQKNMPQPKPVPIHLWRRICTSASSMPRISACSSSVSSSSASSDNTHVPTHLSIAEFFCSANPFHSSTEDLRPKRLSQSPPSDLSNPSRLQRSHPQTAHSQRSRKVTFFVVRNDGYGKCRSRHALPILFALHRQPNLKRCRANKRKSSS